jgi:hypothetical protein
MARVRRPEREQRICGVHNLVFLSFHNTTKISDAVEQIKKYFRYFPELHQLWATRPNVNPPAITTGVGPHGRSTLYIQPLDDCNIDPALRDPPVNFSRSFGTNTTNTVPQASLPIPFTQSNTLPSTPASRSSVESGTSNENETPSATPRPKSYLDEALAKARASIKKIPQKWSFEDRIIELQEYVFVIIINHI